MEVIFEGTNGEKFELELWYYDTVLVMKKRIEKYHGIPVSKQTLVFNNQVMEDERDTEFYGVHFRCRIKLLVDEEPETAVPITNFESSPVKAAKTVSPGKLTVTVVSMCGKVTTEFEVNGYDKVTVIRTELQHTDFPLPPDGYFFIHDQNPMEEDRSFEWHNVKNGDSIDIFAGTVEGEGTQKYKSYPTR
ncbi:hypothetical protein GIB67_032788 [Kingdonia uniflora]|uniref:Ubiquitin-like domain-containing protein n=1 Tax=Kingdonia uniflora TaxID=39325 RepID=A0A7J7MW61_9MAGN|nr:hypothetical protein GIB67_032788 [Kingdonia uniflora]